MRAFITFGIALCICFAGLGIASAYDFTSAGYELKSQRFGNCAVTGNVNADPNYPLFAYVGIYGAFVSSLDSEASDKISKESIKNCVPDSSLEDFSDIEVINGKFSEVMETGFSFTYAGTKYKYVIIQKNDVPAWGK